MTRFFLSYSQKDKAFARKLRKHILETDSANEVFLDEYGLSIGERLRPSLARKISNSDYFLLLASKDSLKSPWVRFEINEARKLELTSGEKKIFVIRLDSLGVNRLPAKLADNLCCDFTSEESFCSDFHRLMSSIERRPVHYRALDERKHDPGDVGYLFSIWIDFDKAFKKQIDFVEYRFDHEFDFGLK